MPASRRPRKLAAIVSVDIAGYSALTERDQELAAELVAGLRERAEAIATQHGGRIFSVAGDGMMLEFASASDALLAALALLAAETELKLRFGVHVGEVVVAANGDLLGHGVNIAARLQAAATTGGLLCSDVVRNSVHSDLADRLSSRGRIRLAKMRETLSVYSIEPTDAAPADARAATMPILAVLAFDNLGRDRETRFFSDGVSEEILYAVSRVSGLKVIGSTSSFAFRGKEKQKAAKSLGATHVLDGSVRRLEDRVRVQAQLSEASTGFVLWSERYDRDLSDALSLQEEIAGEVANALTLALSEARRTPSPKLSPDVFEAYLQAREHLRSGAPQRLEIAEEMFSAIVRDANHFARAWSGLASARLEVLRLSRSDRARLVEDAREAAQRALGIDPGIGEAYAVLAALESEFGRWRERERLLERALDAEPNNPLLLFRQGQFLVSTGRVAAGYDAQAHAYALDPLDPMFAAFHGHNVWAKQSRPDGRKILEDAAQRAPDNVFLWYMRLNTALLDGDFESAKTLRADGERLLPGIKDSPAYRSGQMMQEVMAAPSPEAFLKLGEDFAAMAEKEPSAALDLAVALSVLGFTLPALGIFEEALDNVDAWRASALEAVRPHIGYETALLFIDATRGLRMEREFVRLCARLGLVRYWRDTGNWPDCVEEVAPAYNFRAECAEAL